MRLGGRLQAAIEVLEDMDARHRPAAESLRDWGLSHRFAGAGDRAAIGNLVYDALRNRRSAMAMLDAQSTRAAVLGAVLLSQAETGETLDAAFEGDRFAPERLSDDERRAISGFNIGDAPPEVRANVADWCIPELERAFGSNWAAEAEGLAARPPLDLRVNTIKAATGKVQSALKRHAAAPCTLAPHGLRIAPIQGHGRHPNVQAEPAFQKGWFEVQDEGSQIASRIAATSGPQQVLDYCAGAGGKTLALAAEMVNRGQIFAHDAEKQRLAPIFDRLKRAGCRNIQVVANREELPALTARMDLVLVDAPCTGSGTWRRRPDAKWRLTDRQLVQRTVEQAAILDEAVKYVRPGGHLVYVTCSVFPAENDAQIEAFLAKTPDFTVIDPGASWHESFPGNPDSVHKTGHGCLLTPVRTGTDGFFVSVLQRR